MELKVFKDALSTYGGRWETRQELPVETEILIPDYQPAVLKDVCAVPSITKARSRAAGFTVRSKSLHLKNRSSFPPVPLLPAPPRSGASRNIATAALSVNTASICAGLTFCARLP